MRKKRQFYLRCREKSLSLRRISEMKAQGLLAEWLGTGLQNRLQQFESARDLSRETSSEAGKSRSLFFYI